MKLWVKSEYARMCVKLGMQECNGKTNPTQLNSTMTWISFLSSSKLTCLPYLRWHGSAFYFPTLTCFYHPSFYFLPILTSFSPPFHIFLPSSIHFLSTLHFHLHFHHHILSLWHSPFHYHQVKCSYSSAIDDEIVRLIGIVSSMPKLIILSYILISVSGKRA